MVDLLRILEFVATLVIFLRARLSLAETADHTLNIGTRPAFPARCFHL